MTFSMILAGAVAALVQVPAEAGCGSVLGAPHALELSPVAARQGTMLKMSLRRLGDYGFSPVPFNCASDWQVRPPEHASVDPIAGTLSIQKSAPRGAIINISYVAAARTWETQVKIVGHDETVVFGKWSERVEGNCAVSHLIKEFELLPSGTFSVTYEPFETYRDFWGEYVFEQDTGALRMTVTGGNRRPTASSLTAHARLSASGALVIDQMFKTDTVPVSAQTCERGFAPIE